MRRDIARELGASGSYGSNRRSVRFGLLPRLFRAMALHIV
jgi:hypothetical protein